MQIVLAGAVSDCAVASLVGQVFVDTDDDVRLARRIQRDVACRGRDVAGECVRNGVMIWCVLGQYWGMACRGGGGFQGGSAGIGRKRIGFAWRGRRRRAWCVNITLPSRGTFG
jgi:hypothetical protein